MTIDPNLLRLPPQILIPPRPFPFPFPLPPPAPKTATELARAAIGHLGDASRDVVQEAVNTIKIKNLTADGLLDYLERKVRVGEVLNQLARTWSDTTVTDFADAFQMDKAKLDTMDALVSIAILNSKDLADEILGENMPQTTPQDLQDNRVIVAQSPAAGSVMNPPYMILVAVEYRDVAHAEDVLKSITDQLVDFQGMKLPSAAAQKLQG
jgi:hypothetical protein